MMRRFLILAAAAGIGATPAIAAMPEITGSVREALRAASPGAQLVWWRAGGTTRWGNHWHAGGTGYGYHGAYGYHGYGGAYHYGGWYRPPVAAVARPWYHPAGAFAAGAVMGGIAGAAAASASHPATTTVYNYSQPPTVVNNYYEK